MFRPHTGNKLPPAVLLGRKIGSTGGGRVGAKAGRGSSLSREEAPSKGNSSMVRSRAREPRRGQTVDGTRVALAEEKPVARAVSLRQQLANLTPEVGRRTGGMARASSCLLADAGITSGSFNATGTYVQ